MHWFKIIAISFIFLGDTPCLLSQNWQSVGNGLDFQVRGLFADTIDKILYVTGSFIYADTLPVYSLASWNGSEWNTLDSAQKCNCCNPVLDAIRYKNEIYAGGMFFCMGGVPNTQGIARWNGTNWSSVGGGLIEGYCWFKILNDELYVFGGFDTAGFMPFNSIAKWNGNQWSDVHNFPLFNIGSNVNFINDIAMYKGELYVAGNFEDYQNGIYEIARWNGTQWVNVGGGIKGNAWVNKMVVYNDELYVGGWFYRVDGNVGNFLMKWNGSNWIDINWNLIYIDQIKDMKVYNNKLYVVGAFQFAGDTTLFFYNMASFDGTDWCAIGEKKDPSSNNFEWGIEFYNNELYVMCPDSLDGEAVNYLAKWIGGSLEDTCLTVVGQNEITDKKSGINIFPNPSSGKFSIDNFPGIFGKVKITIYNSIGQMAYENSITSNQQIDISGLPDGIYLLQGKVQNKIFSQKIILQK